ncbi:MAG: alpha/beta fold hydrolase [bacterium]|nr:alpha/beta fold hydrolase [bacterium]MDT8396815.1 alpha/beta fold hydrolase [bacterium]
MSAISFRRLIVLLIILLVLTSSRRVWAGETVFLLHGIANIPLSMKFLESRLKGAGYTVYNLGYPSTRVSIEDAAREVRQKVDALAGQDTVHFVAHSMGNLVARKALEGGLPHLGKMVMIAPPSRGSFAAQRLHDLDIYRWVFGPAGQELPAQNIQFFEKLPLPPCPFGIIAGGLGTEGGYNPLIPGDDDGTVSVEETKLSGASDMVVIRSTHTLILFDEETADQVISFLKTGRFQKPKSE